MARPNWEYIRVDVLLPQHPKLDGLSSASKWTLIELWAHCGQMLTDGFVREAAWKRIGSASTRRQIVEAGLAERADGGYLMHDYLEHQRSRAEVEELRAKRSAAGRRSGQARARARTLAEHPVEHRVEQTANKTRTEAEAEAEAEAEGVVAEVSNQANGSSPPGFDPELIRMTIDEIAKATGRVIDASWAERMASAILAGNNPAEPAAYIRVAIRTETNPSKRFLPTNQPPPFSALCKRHALANCPLGCNS